MPSPVQLAPHQQRALAAIKDFVTGPGDCFILRGGAGTGKTTLLAALARWLEAENRPHAFVAPTGRAARILGDKTGVSASTIHSCIYAFERLTFFEEANAKNDPGVRLRFGLKADDPGTRLFVVDESSMVGDVEDQQDVLRFGSGRLLADLIEYTRIGRPGRPPSDPGAKLLFVGDPAQLPPVAERLSPALSADYLRDTFRLVCNGFELTEVHRQEAGSTILDRASAIRQSIFAKRFNRFDLRPAGEALRAEGIVEGIRRIVDAYRYRSGSCVLITFSNAKALELNRAVRGRLWEDEEADVRVGDRLLVIRNSAQCGLYNGDLVKVVEVADASARRTIRMHGVEPVELSFRGASVAYRGTDGKASRTQCLLLENLLHSKERALAPVEQRALLVDFRQRYPNLKPGTSEFSAALWSDPWFNALQVKYGYALTCHKAQGGEWDTAVVNFESGRGARNEDFFRWAYTAVTRAKHTLVTIEAPWFDVYTSMDWGTCPTVADPANNDATYRDDPDWNRFSFSAERAAIFEHHRRVRAALAQRGIRVDALEHLAYCERYRLTRDGGQASVQFWYKGNSKVSRVEAAAGDRSGDPALVRDALDALKAVLLSAKSTPTDITDPFLCAFLQRLEQVVNDAGMRVLAATSLPYRLRVDLAEGTHRGAIDFCYDGTPKWTKVLEVGGPGQSGGLIERVRGLLD